MAVMMDTFAAAITILTCSKLSVGTVGSLLANPVCNKPIDCQSGKCHDKVCRIFSLLINPGSTKLTVSRVDVVLSAFPLPLKEEEPDDGPSGYISSHCTEETWAATCSSHNDDCSPGLECPVH